MKRLDEILKENGNLTSKGNSSSGSSDNVNEVCPICGGVGFFRKDVPVGHPDFGKAFPCQHKLAEVAYAQLQDLREASGLALLAHMTFENFLSEGLGLSPDKQRNLRQAYDTTRLYAKEPKGWLLLKGGYGSGKTHLAAAIANERLFKGLPALFIVVPDLLDYLRATYSPNSDTSYDDRFESIRSAPLLILDDLGSQSATPWAQEKLFQLLNYRYNAQLPTVITTNRELEEIDLRMRSRLADVALCEILAIQAPDFRQSGSRVESELSTLSLYHDLRFDTFDLREHELTREERESLRDAFEFCRRYAEAPEGWLVLSGEFGSGKTHLAAAIANYREEQGDSALFVVVPDLLDHLRAAFSPNSPVSYDRRFEEVRTTPFLVLDDLGTQSATPWAQEKLFQILNYRYAARLPTVITTSQRREEMEPRLRSRMEDVSRCAMIENFAPSYRGVSRRQPRAARESKRASKKR
jgi:DNA replication protein DnaC